MDFTQRNAQHNQSSNSDVAPSGSSTHHKGNRRRGFSWLRGASVLLLFSSTILVVALLISIVHSTPTNQFKYVNDTENQAVFLSNGQVYFGHIRSINDKYMRLDSIYYLQVNQQVQPDGKTQTGNPTLVPLGCELHRPENEMLLNTSQVTFWENLKNDANENTVPGAIKKDLAANPNGHTCSSTPTSSTPNTSTSKQ
ncbi:MAG TPA: hypothetical protein VLF90_02135 [Patescibacteria group bacterium]|nr:hypothetical protein [Patescibacteria group bacterium]